MVKETASFQLRIGLGLLRDGKGPARVGVTEGW